MARERLDQSPISVRRATVRLGEELADPDYGHIHHLGVAKAFERERIGYITERGVSIQTLKDEWGLGAMVRELSPIKYRKQIPVGETVEITTGCDVQGPFVDFHQQIIREDGIAVVGNSRYAFVDLNTGVAVKRIPKEIIEKLQGPPLPKKPQLLDDPEGSMSETRNGFARRALHKPADQNKFTRCFAILLLANSLLLGLQ